MWGKERKCWRGIGTSGEENRKYWERREKIQETKREN